MTATPIIRGESEPVEAGYAPPLLGPIIVALTVIAVVLLLAWALG